MAMWLRRALRSRWTASAIQAGVLLALLIVFAQFAHYWHPHSSLGVIGYGLIVVAASSIALSPRWPAGAVGVALAATLTSHTLGYEESPIDLALMVALFKAATPQHPLRTVVLGLATVVGYAATQLVTTRGFSLTAFALGSLAVMASLGLGYAVASQRAFTRQKREEETQRRVTDERLRIARELHDVVSHSISTINVQAGVAAHVIDERPEQAKTALITIKETSRDALRELRGILNVLRQVDEVESREPAPGLAQLNVLVDAANQAGIATSASVTGSARQLPAGVELAAYRIIQESLTNVIRHAGRASAQVTVEYQPDRIVIEIRDDGRGASVQPNANGWPEGHGLAGMRERAAAVHGDLEAGPQSGRGFRVRATLPTNGVEP